MTTSLSRVDGPGDAELISAVRGGDVDAYGELFARHVDSARRLARQLAGPGDADDLVSDAFTKVLLVLQRGGGPDLAFRAYLLTAVRRLHVDRLRSGARLRSVGDLTPFDPGLPFHDTAVEGFENAAAARAFASLPERWQMVLWHTEVEQQKPADIAPLLGMSANSVSALAYRAREGLRQAFLSQHAVDPDDVDCAWTRDHLGAHIRGGLSRRDAARVDDHIEGCRACAAVYLELTEVNSGLAALLAPLLLGTAGLGYLSTGSGSGTVATTFTAAKTWVATHASLSAAGGVALTATAAAAVYAVTQLTGHPAPPQVAPPLHRPTVSSSPTAGHHQQGGHHGPGAHGKNGKGPRQGGSTPPSGRGPSPEPSTSTPGPSGGPTSAPTSTTTPPTGGPSTEPTSPPTSEPTTGPTTTPPTQITFTSTPPAHPAIGSSYQVSVTGGSGKPIAVDVDPSTTNAACSMSDATTVHFDHAGTCVLAARETGGRSGAARAADPVTQSIVVPQTQQQVAFDSTAPAEPRVDGSYDVAASSTSGRQVTFVVIAPTGSCALSGSTVTFRHVGPCTLTAIQTGDADLAPASASQSLTVLQGAQSIAFTSSAPKNVNIGDTYDVSATSTSGGAVSFSSASPACSVSGSTVTFEALGTCIIDADQPGSIDYVAAPTVSQSVDVSTDYDLSVSLTPVLDGSGNPQRLQVTVSGLPANGTALLTATGPADLHALATGQCPCKVKGPSQTFTFTYNTQQSPTATVTFSVSTADSPDPVTDNDTVSMTFPIPAADRTFATRTQR